MTDLIEITVKNHVAGKLDVPVYMEFPEGMPPVAGKNTSTLLCSWFSPMPKASWRRYC